MKNSAYKSPTLVVLCAVSAALHFVNALLKLTGVFRKDDTLAAVSLLCGIAMMLQSAYYAMLYAEENGK